jgi:hypothetical protein
MVPLNAFSFSGRLRVIVVMCVSLWLLIILVKLYPDGGSAHRQDLR